MRHTIVTLVATLAMGLTACTAGPILEATPGSTTTRLAGVPGPSRPFGQAVSAASSLQPFESCNEFLDHVKARASERVGPYGLEGYGGHIQPVAMEELSADSTVRAASATDGGVQGVDYSGTNVQVAGVDEPDVVKTDGERIFAVAQGRLFWIDASDTPEIVASMQLGGWGQQLFLSGDRLIILTSESGHGVERFIDERDSIASPFHAQRVVLTEVDVSDPSSMEPVKMLTLDGNVLSSRMADGSIRVVVRSGPVGLDWRYPEGSGIRSEQKAIDANKELIEESTLENWVPWYVLTDHGSRTTSDGPLLGCDRVGHPEEFSGLSMLTVLSIDLEAGLEPANSVGLLAEGQTIYASHDSLYVATSPWMFRPQPLAEGDDAALETISTQIHMFDITDPKSATYVASGDVDGTLLSQWSMDEYEGTLRVVVTDENPWWGSSEVPETSVVTLQHRGNELVQLGSVDGLGKNERVYAVRFIQDKGYVVTFRQVDPLYVVDLADPTRPVVTGELKINGYSAYLHPIGRDLLLGVGQDATDTGGVLGTQLSIFDVSDPTDPRRLSRLTFEDAYSEAEWDHHAFLWWAPDQIAVLPVQRWSFDERSGHEDYFSGAAVVSTSPERVKQIGEIHHPTSEGTDCEDCVGWSAPITRSLVIGDTLFTFSEAGALASDLDSLDEIVWIPFA